VLEHKGHEYYVTHSTRFLDPHSEELTVGLAVEIPSGSGPARIDSRFNGDEYRFGSMTLNFRISAKSMSNLEYLLGQILETLSGHFSLEYLNNDLVRPKIFIRSLKYLNEKIGMEIINKDSLTHLISMAGALYEIPIDNREVFHTDTLEIVPGVNFMILDIGEINDAEMEIHFDGFRDKVLASISMVGGFGSMGAEYKWNLVELDTSFRFAGRDLSFPRPPGMYLKMELPKPGDYAGLFIRIPRLPGAGSWQMGCQAREFERGAVPKGDRSR
jgi:hypothetical protein